MLILCFKKVGNRLQFVQREMHKAIETVIKYPQSMNSTIDELRKMKSLYGRLWKISRLINERFNWTILAVLIVYFCSISVGIYWIFMRIRFNHNVSMWRKESSSKIIEYINFFFIFVQRRMQCILLQLWHLCY